jgi:hypothetical protein
MELRLILILMMEAQVLDQVDLVLDQVLDQVLEQVLEQVDLVVLAMVVLRLLFVRAFHRLMVQLMEVILLQSVERISHQISKIIQFTLTIFNAKLLKPQLLLLHV